MRDTVQFFSGSAVLAAIFFSWLFTLSFANRIYIYRNREKYVPETFLVTGAKFYRDHGESGDTWWLTGMVAAREERFIPPLRDAPRPEKAADLLARYPEGTKIDVLHNPDATEDIVQNETLRVLAATPDLWQEEASLRRWLGLRVLVPVPLTLSVYLAVRYLNVRHVRLVWWTHYMSPTSTPRWFVPNAPSRRVDRTRQQLQLTLDDQRACPLRHIAYGMTSWKWRELEDAISDRPRLKRAVGEVNHCKLWDKNDPVRSYLVVRLWSDIHLEAVQFNADPTITQLFVRGTLVGALHEQHLPGPDSWWQRIVHGERCWQVLVQENVVGKVELRYPVGKGTLLSFRLNDGTSLPFAVAYGSGTNLVIPPDAPEVDPDTSLLYFLVAIVFRRLILEVDDGL